MKSDIQRLLKVADNRNKESEYSEVRCKLLKSDMAEARRLMAEDRISFTVLIEAAVRGYNGRHPSMLAMIDQWVRDEGVDRRPIKPAKRLPNKEVEDVLDMLGRATIEGED